MVRFSADSAHAGSGGFARDCRDRLSFKDLADLHAHDCLDQDPEQDPGSGDSMTVRLKPFGEQVVVLLGIEWHWPYDRLCLG